MTSYSQKFLLHSPLLILLLLPLQEIQYHAFCYVRPLHHRKQQNKSKKYVHLDINRSDGLDIQDENFPKKNVFVDFWGMKITSNDENETADIPDPRYIPSVPTLDVHDGPLPPGAYIMEGKSEFDAKSTCRVSIDVKTDIADATHDPDTVVRRLQACIDAGFDTFQIHDQTPGSLDIIRRMNQDTPSYINRHWSLKMKIQPISPNVNNSSTKTNLRHSVFELIEQTGSDALDSLKIDCKNLQSTYSIATEDAVLEIFEHLVDLQREGWIRSIGIENMSEQKLRHIVMSYFDNFIDFEEQEGNLLLPPFSNGLYNSKKNIRMADTLAGGLLTNAYSHNDRREKRTNDDSNPLLLLTNNNIRLVKEWKKRYDLHQKATSTSVTAWKQYQESVVGQLNWIAMKYDVSITAVALRWALECGITATKGNKECPLISSALADINFDDPKDDAMDKLVEFRQVFRFKLDAEDREILSDLSASQHNEKEHEDIDFNDSTLWL